MLQKFIAAFNGILYCLRTQINMLIHLVATLAVIGLAWHLEVRSWEWAILILTITVVLAAEALNTAIEVTIDMSTKQYHPLARIAKDVAAGAVLIAALGAVAVGYFIFGPYLGF